MRHFSVLTVQRGGFVIFTSKQIFSDLFYCLGHESNIHWYLLSLLSKSEPFITSSLKYFNMKIFCWCRIVKHSSSSFSQCPLETNLADLVDFDWCFAFNWHFPERMELVVDGVYWPRWIAASGGGSVPSAEMWLPLSTRITHCLNVSASIYVFIY